MHSIIARCRAFLLIALLLCLPFTSHAAPLATSQPSAQAQQRALPAGYLEQYTPHFRFQYPPRWRKLAALLIKDAESQLNALGKELGYTFKGRILLRMSAPGAAFASIQPYRWIPHPSIAGLAYPKQKIITLRVRSADGIAQIYQTFRHEISHVLLAQAAGYRSFPLWFTEGVAMIQSDDYGDFERFLRLSQAQLTSSLPDIHTLQRRFPPSPTRQELAYAISQEFVRFLQRQKQGVLPLLLRHMRAGNTFNQSLALATGQDWDQLQEEWNSHLSFRYHWLPLLFNQHTIWILIVFLFFFAYRRLKTQRRRQFAALPDDPQDQLPPQA